MCMRLNMQVSMGGFKASLADALCKGQQGDPLWGLAPLVGFGTSYWQLADRLGSCDARFVGWQPLATLPCLCTSNMEKACGQSAVGVILPSYHSQVHWCIICDSPSLAVWGRGHGLVACCSHSCATWDIVYRPLSGACIRFIALHIFH